jgi:Glycine-rich domain-containing protein-like
MFGRKREMIEALNLSAIADVAAKRHGWSPDRVQNAENEYRKFLYLLVLRPKETLVPWHDDLDLFWHEHILHTEQYAVDCRHLFGRFIHHDPSISNRPIEGAGARLETAWAYYRTFGRRAKVGSSWRLPTAESLAAIDNLIPAGAKTSVPSGAGGSGSCAGGGHGCGGHGCGGGGGH